MNFCYWPGNKAGDFEYGHMITNLANILKTNPDYFKPSNLAKTTKDFLKNEVYNNLDFSLLEERARLVSELGAAIELFYEGSFVKFMEKADYDAVKLVNLIVKEFPGFRDEAILNGEQIFFYKRA